MSDTLNRKVGTATKWSAAAEIGAKLITPISTIFLARLLTPSAFGVLVTATMIISFAEIFTDAGFQKYIVQHEFKDKQALYRSTNVAFIANLVMSLLMWGGIALFSEGIARVVGNPGYGLVIAVSSACIPLAAFSSIQMALFKRNLDFKTLFTVRIIGTCIPIIVTIPLAFMTHSYWSLIIGMLALNLSNAIILTIKSQWKPRLWFDLKLFNEMFSFTLWSMIESILIWATGYVDIFFVGRLLDEHYLGIYRTSMSTVGQIINLVAAAATPVLFASLSRLQSDPDEFKTMFFKFEKVVGILVIPMGVGIYIFRDFITEILLGPQWTEAAYFIGLWALTSSITVVLAHFCSEVYRSKGKPKLSALVQLSHIAVLIPTVLLAIPHGFHILCEWRALIRMELILANLVVMYYLVKISPLKMIMNISPMLIAAGVMWLFLEILPSSMNIGITILYIILGITGYLAVLTRFKTERKIVMNLTKLLRK